MVIYMHVKVDAKHYICKFRYQRTARACMLTCTMKKLAQPPQLAMSMRVPRTQWWAPDSSVELLWALPPLWKMSRMGPLQRVITIAPETVIAVPTTFAMLCNFFMFTVSNLELLFNYVQLEFISQCLSDRKVNIICNHALIIESKGKKDTNIKNWESSLHQYIARHLLINLLVKLKTFIFYKRTLYFFDQKNKNKNTSNKK